MDLYNVCLSQIIPNDLNILDSNNKDLLHIPLSSISLDDMNNLSPDIQEILRTIVKQTNIQNRQLSIDSSSKSSLSFHCFPVK